MEAQKENCMIKESHLENLAILMYRHSQNAIRALYNHDENLKYSIVLAFSQMAYQTYLTMVSYYEEYQDEIDNHMIKSLFHYYTQFQSEISGTVSRKDKNHIYVESSFTEYKEAQREYMEFLQRIRGGL